MGGVLYKLHSLAHPTSSTLATDDRLSNLANSSSRSLEYGKVEYVSAI